MKSNPTYFPTVRFGSPYLPRLEVIRQAVAALQSAIYDATNDEARHNARLLKLLYGLSIFCGLRISEAGTLAASQVDLRRAVGGPKDELADIARDPRQSLDDGLANCSLPESRQTLTRELLSELARGQAFYFMNNGQPLKASAAAIREALVRLSVPLPRWHAGRHFVRTRMLEERVTFSAIYAVIGHQSAGQELFNPYRPDVPDEYWQTYLQFARGLADEVGWREISDWQHGRFRFVRPSEASTGSHSQEGLPARSRPPQSYSDGSPARLSADRAAAGWPA